MKPQLRQLVIERDRQRCRRCRRQLTAGEPVSVHHRRLRSQGGVDCACNLVLLCGSGTTGCHGYVHSHVADARSLGLLVSAYADPRAVLVRTGRSEPQLLACSTEH